MKEDKKAAYYGLAIATLAVLATLFAVYGNQDWGNQYFNILKYVIFVLIASPTIWLLYEIIKIIRRGGTSKIVSKTNDTVLRKTFHALSDFIGTEKEYPNLTSAQKLDILMTELDNFFDELTKIYSSYTRSTITFTAKMIATDGTRNTKKLKTLAQRPFNKERKRRESYQKNQNFDKFLLKNSDLKAIFGSEDASKLRDVHYIKSNLVKDDNFLNPAIEDFRTEVKKVEKYDASSIVLNKFKEGEWDSYLKYRSTMVVPLGLMSWWSPKGEGITMQRENGMSSEGDSIFGTLCVDSSKPLSFEDDLNLTVLQTISEAIYKRLYAIYGPKQVEKAGSQNNTK